MKPEANILNKLKKPTRRIARNVKPRRSSGNDYVTNNYLDAKLEGLEYKIEIKFARLAGEMDSKITRLAGEMDSKFAKIEGELNQKADKTDLQALENKLIKWMIGNSLAIIAILAGLGILK